MAIDIFLYQGEPNPNDIVLRDPTTSSGGGVPAINGNATMAFDVTTATSAAREIFRGGITSDFIVTTETAAAREIFHGGITEVFAVTTEAAQAKEIFRGAAAASFDATAETASGKEIFRGGITEVFVVTTQASAAREVFRGNASELFSVTQAGLVGREVITGLLTIHVQALSFLGDDVLEIFRNVNSPATFPEFSVTQANASGAITFTSIVGDGAATFPVTQAGATGTVPVSEGGYWQDTARNKAPYWERVKFWDPPKAPVQAIAGAAEMSAPAPHARGTGYVESIPAVAGRAMSLWTSPEASSRATYTPQAIRGRVIAEQKSLRTSGAGTYDRSHWDQLEAEDRMMELLIVLEAA